MDYPASDGVITWQRASRRRARNRKLAAIAVFSFVTACFAFLLPFLVFSAFGWAGRIGVAAGGVVMVGIYLASVPLLWRRLFPAGRAPRPLSAS